jgi:enamine deaminase RidA (YjgF/YER057c/UK114 family)
MKKILLPKGVAKPRGNYSHGVLVKPGYLLFIAGQTAIGPDGTIVGVGNPYVQAKQVFENMAAVLSEAGGDFNDIVKITTYYYRHFIQSKSKRSAERVFS